MRKITVSEGCLGVYPWMKFGYCFVKNLSWAESSDYLRDKQKETEDYIRKQPQSLVEKAKCISRFYKVQGEKNRSHIESLIKSVSNGKSINPVNPVVDSVVIAVLRNALAMGVHDLDRIQGEIVLDVAAEGEKFTGIGNRTILTRSNEVVLRDQTAIWASYTQGPDAATVVDASTKNAMILGFFTPETSRETMVLGIQEAADLPPCPRLEEGHVWGPYRGSRGSIAGPLFKGPGVVRAVYPMDRAYIVIRYKGAQ